MKQPLMMLATLIVVACSEGDGAGGGGSAESTESVSGGGAPSQFVITLHVQGGSVGDLAYARSQVAGFGTCAEAKMDAETWKIYALMKPGVEEKFAVEERNMLEAYVRPPLELQMSSWSYNDGDWFSLIGK